MLLHINKNSSMVQRIVEDSNDIAIIAARLSNELGGWAQYKNLPLIMLHGMRQLWYSDSSIPLSP